MSWCNRLPFRILPEHDGSTLHACRQFIFTLLKVDIFDEKNNFVRRLNKTGKKYGPGNLTFRWNMMPGIFEEIYKEVDGYKRKTNYSIDEKVPAGKYKIRLTAKPTYSSKKYFADKEQIDLEIKENGAVEIN